MLEAAGTARDYALVRIFADTAFRLGGVWNLRVEGIRSDQMTITTWETKNGDYHSVAMALETWEALRIWLDERQVLVAQLGSEHGYVFVHSETGERLSYLGLREILRRLGKRAGVERWNPQAFRHSWGTWAAREGLPVTATQAQLGHSSAATTMDFYYKASPEQLRDAVDKRAKQNGNRQRDKRNDVE